MAKLRTLKPLVQRMPPRLTQSAATYSADIKGDWSKLYNLQAWRAKPKGLRWQTLMRDNWTCQICGLVISDQSKAHADHIEPHRGNMALFLDPNNLQTCCESCHGGTKQRAERRLYR